MIESSNNFLTSFQKFLKLLYKDFSHKIKCSKPLKDLIIRTGQTLKNNEWHESEVMDLSTMTNDFIFINNFSTGKDFSTNIKTLKNYDLVYGSIRPYFKKAGFALDVNYIAGSVYSFETINKKDLYWVLACICSDAFHDFTNMNSQGTKMPIINWDTFCSYKCPYDDNLIDTFNSLVEPLFKSCVVKMKQIRQLSKIKQQLLQKYF